MSTLAPLADGLWSIYHRDFGLGITKLTTRTNVVRLADGTLAVSSPGPIEAQHVADIRALGEVSVVLVPNLMHTMFTERAIAAFPAARVIAAPGADRRVKGLTTSDRLGGPLPAALAGTLEALPLEGCPKLAETVFFHPASRTVLSVDLAFNLRDTTGFTRFVMWLNNANDQFCVTRLARASFIADMAAARASVDRMCDAWDIERIVVSHGEVLPTDGRRVLREAWHA